MLGIVRKGKYEGQSGTILDWDGYWFKVLLPGDSIDPENGNLAVSIKPNNLLFSLDDIDKIMHDPRSRQLNINYKPKIDYSARLIGYTYMRFAERPEQYEAPSLPS